MPPAANRDAYGFEVGIKENRWMMVYMAGDVCTIDMPVFVAGQEGVPRTVQEVCPALGKGGNGAHSEMVSFIG